MFKSNLHVVVAMTTTDFDALRVSLPPLRKLHEKVTLVIRNDNPEINLKQCLVRKIYSRGKLHIINSVQSLGELESQIATVEYIRDNNIPCDWILFAEDDDVLIDVSVPKLDEKKFAIVHNATTLSESLTDIFKISRTWTDGAPIGKTGPHFSITGTMIRAQIFFEFAGFMRGIVNQTCQLLSQTKYYVPISEMMWIGLNTFMRIRHPEMSPIYMNRTNYVAIEMGHRTQQCGRIIPTNATTRKTVHKIIKKFIKLVELTAAQNMVAENQ